MDFIIYIVIGIILDGLGKAITMEIILNVIMIIEFVDIANRYLSRQARTLDFIFSRSVSCVIKIG